jgi:hypothetical protein
MRIKADPARCAKAIGAFMFRFKAEWGGAFR